MATEFATGRIKFPIIPPADLIRRRLRDIDEDREKVIKLLKFAEKLERDERSPQPKSGPAAQTRCQDQSEGNHG